MTTITQAHGGGAQPASIDTSGKVAGGAALRVYGFDSEADALAAGYVCEGGPAMSVALITDAQIASGAWKAEGDPAALAVYTAPDGMPVEGGYAVPVYAVNGWGSTPAPSGPQFSSAEVGTVNASTVAVTFDSNVDASDYSAGVTIKVNGAATSITSSTRQADHAVVYYVIPVLWHGSGDAVTWEYASGSGNIVAESDSTPLGNVTAQSVTNNCEYAALLDLQADTLALNDGDPVSTWADQSGNGRNFTQTGSARPTKQTIDGYPAVVPDHIDDWMLGPKFADNLDSFAIVIASRYSTISDSTYTQIMKMNGFANPPGWGAGGWAIYLESGALDYVGKGANNGIGDVFSVASYMETARGTLHIFVNSVEDSYDDNFGTFVSFSNNEPVTLFTDGLTYFNGFPTRSFMILAPAPNATNRAALETRLAARYGITL